MFMALLCKIMEERVSGTQKLFLDGLMLGLTIHSRINILW